MTEKWESMEVAYYAGFDDGYNLAAYRSKLCVILITAISVGVFFAYIWMGD